CRSRARPPPRPRRGRTAASTRPPGPGLRDPVVLPLARRLLGGRSTHHRSCRVGEYAPTGERLRVWVRCHADEYGMQHECALLTAPHAAQIMRSPTTPRSPGYATRGRGSVASGPPFEGRGARHPRRRPGVGLPFVVAEAPKGYSADERGNLVMVETRVRRGRGTGWIVFAGIVMILAGGNMAINGLWALHSSNQIEKSFGDTLLFSSSNLDTWGWIYLI